MLPMSVSDNEYSVKSRTPAWELGRFLGILGLGQKPAAPAGLHLVLP
jgi:hypothetical protein